MRVLVVYHSLYGHVQSMAKAVQGGAQEVAGVEVVLRRVREFQEFSISSISNRKRVTRTRFISPS